MWATDKFIIGINIGGTNFGIGVVDPQLQVRLFDKIRVHGVFSIDHP